MKNVIISKDVSNIFNSHGKRTKLDIGLAHILISK